MRRLATFLLCSLFAPTLFAHDTDNLKSSIDTILRPGDLDEATPVQIAVYVVDIIDIDDVARTITLDYFFVQTWNDPRLASKELKSLRDRQELGISDIWNPRVTRVNLKDHNLLDPLLRIDDAGNVLYRERSIDTFTAPLDLKRFPFDEQFIKLKFISTQYDSNEVNLAFGTDRSGNMREFSASGWSFKGIDTENTVQTIETMERSFTGIDVLIHLERDSGFYVWKVIVPLGFIVFMAWTVFWIDPANFGPQISISTASVITLIAFQLSLAELLPKISYLTEIDLYALATSFFVFLALGESILTARLAKVGRHELSLKIDRWMRSAYPAMYSILLLFVIF